MAAVADRRLGAPLSVRALATLLALGLSVLPLWLLFRSLSVVTIEATRQAPVMIDLIPLPAPTPPPPEPVPPARRLAQRLSAAPAPASAPPAAPDPTIVTTPAPPPAAPGPDDGAGTAGTGIGSGSGGKGGGSGDGGAPAGPVFTPASWAVVPGTPEIMPFDPPRAMRERVNGQVLLRCNVLRTRKLTNCRVVEERPRGYGFGRAALGASRVFLMNPPTRDGVPEEKAWVEIPVAFNHRR
jgi:TonB family protein